MSRTLAVTLRRLAAAPRVRFRSARGVPEGGVMVTGVLLALSASLLWGTADFAGGRLSRQLPLLVVLACSQGTGLVALVLVALVRGHLEPAAAGWGAVAGVLSLGSVTCFYRALVVGTMGVVAPVVATSVAVPVLVGVAGGERLGAAAGTGIVLASCGVVLASRQVAHEPPTDHRLSVVLSVAAALFAGVQLVALQRAGVIDALTAVTASRATSATVFVVALVLTGASAPRRALPSAVVVGLLDTSANLAYTVASTRTLLSLAAVLASLYPLVTIALARAVLHERPRRAQSVGAALALVGVLLIVGG